MARIVRFLKMILMWFELKDDDKGSFLVKIVSLSPYFLAKIAQFFANIFVWFELKDDVK